MREKIGRPHATRLLKSSVFQLPERNFRAQRANLLTVPLITFSSLMIHPVVILSSGLPMDESSARHTKFCYLEPWYLTSHDMQQSCDDHGRMYLQASVECLCRARQAWPLRPLPPASRSLTSGLLCRASAGFCIGIRPPVSSLQPPEASGWMPCKQQQDSPATVCCSVRQCAAVGELGLERRVDRCCGWTWWWR